MLDDLNDENFLIYAMKSYNSPHCIMSEFEGDIKRTKYLKKLFRKYKKSNILKERLILNHIIVLYNIFGESATRMLFYKIDASCWDTLVTFLVYLERMPDAVPEFGIVTSDIMLDENIINTLRTI